MQGKLGYNITMYCENALSQLSSLDLFPSIM